MIAFVNGNPVDGFMGAIPESQIREFIDRVAGKGGAARPDMTDALKAAERARAAGDSELATGIYSDILDATPDNADAIAGLADLLFEAGDRQGAEQTIASAPKELSNSPALAAVRARIALADQAAGLGDPVELERRLAENPKNHQARFDLAMIHNAQGRRSDAAEELLEIIRSDRTWNDDAARAQLLKLFEAMPRARTGPPPRARRRARRVAAPARAAPARTSPPRQSTARSPRRLPQIAAAEVSAAQLPQQRRARRRLRRRLGELPARQDDVRPVADPRRLPFQQRQRLVGRARLDHTPQQRQRLGQAVLRAGRRPLARGGGGAQQRGRDGGVRSRRREPLERQRPIAIATELRRQRHRGVEHRTVARRDVERRAQRPPRRLGLRQPPR